MAWPVSTDAERVLAGAPARAWRASSGIAAPTGSALYLDARFGMTNTRLAIVDLDSGRPADLRRARALLGDAERRDLQLRRASRGARGARPRLLDRLGHGGDRPRLRGVGARVPPAPERRLRARDLGSRAAGALPRPGSLRRAAALPRLVRRRSLLRLRGQGAAPASDGARASSIPGRSSTSSRSGRRCPIARPSSGSGSSRRRTISSSAPTARSSHVRWWDLDFAAQQHGRAGGGGRGRRAARAPRRFRPNPAARRRPGCGVPERRAGLVSRRGARGSRSRATICCPRSASASATRISTRAASRTRSRGISTSASGGRASPRARSPTCSHA